MAKPKRLLFAVQHELNDLARGVCGGFLFGIPLLYTMEVWWIGSVASPPRMVFALGMTFAVVYLLSRTEGFRRFQATRERESIGDAIEALAIGLLCSAIMMAVLHQITLETSLSEALGIIIFESVPFSVGVALSNQFLDGSDRIAARRKDNPSQSNQNRAHPATSPHQATKSALNRTLADLGATLVGAMIIAFSIAPTDEVPDLVSAIGSSRLMATVIVSLVISYGIVFQANFTQQSRRRDDKGLFQDPLSETIFSYLISLLAAAVMLVFFRQIDLNTPLELVFRKTIILGLPATIGGAAGRLAL
jgi:putative integral membrane protein (TIGR02587 family)